MIRPRRTRLRNNGHSLITVQPWSPESEPVRLPGPQFFSGWTNSKLAAIYANTQRLQDDPNLTLKAVFTAAPGAMYLLVPLFALVLRRVYGGRWWSLTLRLLVIANIYLMLASFGMIYTVLAGLSQ